MAAEQVSKKIARIAQLLHGDPQLMALSGIKLAQLFCFLGRILGTSRENIRGEPFDGSIAKTTRALGPISNFKPLQRIEQKRTITWRVDDGLSLSEGGGASRRERVFQFLHSTLRWCGAAQRFDRASLVDIEVSRGRKFSRFKPIELGLDPLGLLVAKQFGEQRYSRAQTAQADTHLVHAFGVRPLHRGFVGSDVSQSRPCR